MLCSVAAGYKPDRITENLPPAVAQSVEPFPDNPKVVGSKTMAYVALHHSKALSLRMQTKKIIK